jgi:hypothetical protein
MNDNFLDDMQQELVALLKSDEVLGQLPIIDERVGDVLKEVEKGLGLYTNVDGKFGACVIVQSPTATDEMPAAPGGILQTDWSFLVLEDPTVNDGVNGFQMRALKIVRRIVRVAKQYYAEGLCTMLVPKKPSVVPAQIPGAPVAYEVHFTCTEQRAGAMLKVTQPTLSPKSGAAPQTVTMTSDAGADIYYTLDGSAPWSGNGILYSGPVTAPAAGTLRARAFKPGYVGSNASAADFT